MVAGGVIMSSSSSSSSRINKHNTVKMSTWFVLLFVIAVCSGLLIGYEIGIIGGIVLMPKFLEENFPNVIVSTSQYCTFNSNTISWFASSLYCGALFMSFLGFQIPRGIRSKACIMFGCLNFLLGAAHVVYSVDPKIITGRLFLGYGLGLTIQNIPIYISETAHYNYRGSLIVSFHMMITIGIFVANLVNYVNNTNSGWGWKVILTVALAPAIIIFIGSLLLPNSPNLMVEDGEFEKAKNVLQSIRDSNDNVDEEFNNICAANEALKMVKTPWKSIMERKHRPHLVMAIAIPLFQQLCGMSVIILYAPLLFKTIGFGSNASLMSAVIIGGVNVAATFLAIILANRLRRRVLLIAGGVLMFVCQIIIGTLIRDKLGDMVGSIADISTEYVNLLVVALICICISSFAWSWGPLGWFVPSEVFPLEIRSSGESITVLTNMLITFVMARVFLNMLCHFKYGLFYIFACVSLTMTIFTIFFLPETTDVPIEEMSKVWKQHWFWRSYVINLDGQDVNGPCCECCK